GFGAGRHTDAAHRSRRVRPTHGPDAAESLAVCAAAGSCHRWRVLIMEKMPFNVERDGQDVRFHQHVGQPALTQPISTDWRDRLPLLAGATVTLRELKASDAPSLFALLTTEEVSRFISPPPNTVEGFERFIAWTLRQRSVGSYACFAVTIDA